jgi:uncharacterized protein
MSRSCLVDTNILLRFLLGDPPELAERARELVAQADSGKVELQVPSLIVAEAVFTLESFYRVSKPEVCQKLELFLRSRGVVPLEPLIFDALNRYAKYAVHFADAYLAASAAAQGIPVYSFDEDFKRFKDIEWRH